MRLLLTLITKQKIRFIREKPSIKTKLQLFQNFTNLLIRDFTSHSNSSMTDLPFSLWFVSRHPHGVLPTCGTMLHYWALKQVTDYIKRESSKNITNYFFLSIYYVFAYMQRKYWRYVRPWSYVWIIIARLKNKTKKN